VAPLGFPPVLDLAFSHGQDRRAARSRRPPPPLRTPRCLSSAGVRVGRKWPRSAQGPRRYLSRCWTMAVQVAHAHPWTPFFSAHPAPPSRQCSQTEFWRGTACHSPRFKGGLAGAFCPAKRVMQAFRTQVERHWRHRRRSQRGGPAWDWSRRICRRLPDGASVPAIGIIDAAL